ncbi:MAG: ABC transporter permease [Oscillibacter sp.]|nr:ABC transporter permease [Oscillibacter sp.]
MREKIHTSGIWKSCQNSGLKSYAPGLAAILLLILLGQILRPGFASSANISSILNQASVLAVVCIGQLVVIAGTGGIDLSTGACVSMGALTGSMFMDGNMVQLPLAILITLLLGAAAGCLNGTGIQLFKIPALAMTLIMSTVIDGFTKAVTKGKPSLNLPKLYKAIIGQPIAGRFCAIILIAAVFVVLYELLLGKTSFGKSIYVMGSNRTAAGMCGLNVRFLSVFVYVISGAMASLAGLILVGYVGSAQMGMGDAYTMLSIAAVVTGGAKVTGGKGSLLGGVIGSVVLVLLSTVLTSMGMPEGARQFFQGMILLAVLIANCRLPFFRQ